LKVSLPPFIPNPPNAPLVSNNTSVKASKNSPIFFVTLVHRFNNLLFTAIPLSSITFYLVVKSSVNGNINPSVSSNSSIFDSKDSIKSSYSFI